MWARSEGKHLAAQGAHALQGIDGRSVCHWASCVVDVDAGHWQWQSGAVGESGHYPFFYFYAFFSFYFQEGCVGTMSDGS